MKKWRSRLVVSIILFSLVFLNIPGVVQAQLQSVVYKLKFLKFDPLVMEEDFIELLPSLLGLDHLLPVSPMLHDYISLLQERKVIPPDFVVFLGRPITKGKAAFLVVNALGLKATSTERFFWKGERLALMIARRHQIIPVEEKADPSQFLSGPEVCAIALRITDESKKKPLPGANSESILAVRNNIEKTIISRKDLVEFFEKKSSRPY